MYTWLNTQTVASLYHGRQAVVDWIYFERCGTVEVKHPFVIREKLLICTAGRPGRQRRRRGLKRAAGSTDNKRHLRILTPRRYYRGLLMLAIIIDLIPNYTSVTGCHRHVWSALQKRRPSSAGAWSVISCIVAHFFLIRRARWTFTMRI